MIQFTNPGEIDVRLITTLGTNVKENDSAIGYFGTGLKYAIAVLLREHCSITIWSGHTCHEFRLRPDIIRGKEFNFIDLYSTSDGVTSKIPLGFTTDLGRNWSALHAFRELWSNAQDESGLTKPGGDFAPTEGRTLIEVSGKAIDEAWDSREEMILATRSGRQLHKSLSAECYFGNSSSIFYKGFAVYKSDRPSLFTWNVISALDLTEDRTAKYSWQVNSMISHAIAFMQDKSLLRQIMSCGESYAEHHLSWQSYNLSEPGLEVLDELYASNPLSLPESLFRLAKKRMDKSAMESKGIEPTEAHREAITKTTEKLFKVFGVFIDVSKIQLVSSTGLGTLGRFEESTYYITPDLIELDTFPVALLGLYIQGAHGYSTKTLGYEARLCHYLGVALDQAYDSVS